MPGWHGGLGQWFRTSNDRSRISQEFPRTCRGRAEMNGLPNTFTSGGWTAGSGGSQPGKRLHQGQFQEACTNMTPADYTGQRKKLRSSNPTIPATVLHVKLCSKQHFRGNEYIGREKSGRAFTCISAGSRGEPRHKLTQVYLQPRAPKFITDSCPVNGVCMRLKSLRMFLPPVAHVALHGHGVIRGDFVAIQDTLVPTGRPKQFSISMFNQQRDDLGFFLALAHG